MYIYTRIYTYMYMYTDIWNMYITQYVYLSLAVEYILYELQNVIIENM